MVNLFRKHPIENHMKGWWEHCKSASGVGIRMFFASMIFILHGIFPFIPIPKRLNFMEMIMFLLDENNKRKKENKMINKVTPKQYLEMWLSEQIPTGEWLRLLEWRPDINELYQKHLEKTNG